ncbi:hypothetical protein NDA16_001395 [Ustilago loliicola]|nr:hypothetical protein NDA16_001395 [Ustilago loliicola]
MLFSSKPLTSALVAMVTLSITVSAALDPIEQHLLARDGSSFRQSKEASGKLATPVDLSNAKAPPQAVLKLVGDDLHTNASRKPSLFEDSKIAVPAGEVDAGNKAHCYLGHTTANIRRIRYKMSVQLDKDESGASTVAKADSVKGVVVKATSGLYSNKNPDQGSCAKTLARHGEVCANRPYIVPATLLPHTSSGPAAPPAAGADKPDTGAAKPDPKQQQVDQGGHYIKKRSQAAAAGVQPLGDWHKVDDAADVVFKRDTNAAPDQTTDITASGFHSETNGPAGTICIDAVKRDEQVTKVVPTKVKPSSHQPGTPLHFELVRSDDKKGVWNQIIYDTHGNPIDVTHLELSSVMSFWRAEYYCAECKSGHKQHTVYYENVEIEVDEVDEHAIPPEVQCEGVAKSTNVHKREKSRYQDKNKSGVEYKGVIYSIDRVALGAFDKNGKGGGSYSGEAQVQPIYGEVPAKQARKTIPDPAESKSQAPDADASDAKKPDGVKKREVVIEDDSPIF